MAKPPVKAQRIVLRAGENIGVPAAEHDQAFLSDCFVKLPILDAIADITSHRCIVLGRTGAGKSALLLHLESVLPGASRIAPNEASFEHVGNSTIVRHLSELGIDLHAFYEYLWKHIIVVHVIRECLGVRTEQHFRLMVGKIDSFVRRDQKKAAVVKYLERHGGKFWVDAEEISKQLTSSVVDDLSAAAGLPRDALEARIEARTSWKEEEVRTFKKRAQEIVNSLQLRELNETINALSDLMRGRSSGNHILIDDLDARWGGTIDCQYALIRSLIECIKTFRRIPNLKIIVALREDLYEATIDATKDKHFQAEKFEGLIYRLRWTDAQLLDVVKTRLNHLLKLRYSSRGTVTANEVFPPDIRGKRITTYLVEKTLRRPRDIIALVNKILSTSQQYQLPLPARAVSSIEGSYSRERLEALVYEWQSCHPLLKAYMACVAKSTSVLELQQIDDRRLVELICEAEALDRPPVDEVERRARAAYSTGDAKNYHRLATSLVCCLFKVGAIGVKLRAEEPYRFCYEEHAVVGEAELTHTSRVIVHPMLQFALGWARHEQAEAA